MKHNNLTFNSIICDGANAQDFTEFCLDCYLAGKTDYDFNLVSLWFEKSVLLKYVRQSLRQPKYSFVLEEELRGIFFRVINPQIRDNWNRIIAFYSCQNTDWSIDYSTNDFGFEDWRWTIAEECLNHLDLDFSWGLPLCDEEIEGNEENNLAVTE